MPEPFAFGPQGLDRRRVTQCALSRVCGGCGESLGRPVAFVGTGLEADRNAFHVPPLHTSCVEEVLTAYRGEVVDTDLGGGWVVLTTSGFEYVRPSGEDLDRRAVFSPNSVIDRRDA